MKKKFLIFWAISLALVSFGKLSFAADQTDAVKMMTGQTTVTQYGRNTYGGMTGGYALYNTNADNDYGFDQAKISTTCLQNLFSPLCFFLVSGSASAGSDRLLLSKTSIQYQGDAAATTVYELPALFFGGINVFSGDVFGNLDYLKFWGRGVSDGANGDGASWKLDGYQTNPDSRVKWGSAEFDKYSDKLDSLAGSGATLAQRDFTSVNPLWLQGSMLSDNGETDKPKFPEGKVWVVNGNLSLSGNLTYNGKGTILVNGGNLTVAASTKLSTSIGSSLGIIVLGDNSTGNCTFQGNNTINAMVLCKNKMTVSGSDSDFSGSFVAGDFDTTIASNINFSYDSKLSSNMPPGFNYLNIPRSASVGNR